jgi:hypothetical protein
MPRKTVALFDGDDYERLTELRAAVAVGERKVLAAKLNGLTVGLSARLGDDEPSATDEDAAELEEAKAAYDAFMDEAADRAESWVVQSIGHEAWRELVTAHPPRKITEGEGDAAKEVTHPEDEQFDLNTESFPKAILLFADADDADHRTILKAGGTDLARIGTRLKRLSIGQIDSLWLAAWTLNTGAAIDPKVSRFSIAKRSTES